MVLMVSIFYLLSNSSNLFSRPLGTFLSALITISITVTPNFHELFLFSFLFSSNVQVFIFSLYFIFPQWSTGTLKSTWSQVFFLFVKTMSYPLAGIRWSVCISKSQRILFVSFCQILISCTIPSESHNQAQSCTPFVQVCSIRLPCD